MKITSLHQKLAVMKLIPNNKRDRSQQKKVIYEKRRKWRKKNNFQKF